MLHLESPKKYANPVDYISEQMTCGCLSFCFRKNPEAETDLGEPFVTNIDEFEDNADEKNMTQITINPHEVSLIETMEGDSALDNSSTNISFGTFTRGLETRPHENVPDHELTDIQKLEKHCPTATNAERQRFLNAKGGKYDLALEQLKHYLNWREEYDLDVLIESKTVPSDDDFESCASSDETLDEIDWKYASDKALSYDTSHPHDLPSALPQLAKILTIPGSDENLRDKTGNRILHLLPAQMDPNMAQDSTFALCIAFYLERKLDRDSLEQMTVAIDVRAGAGWANPRPGKFTLYMFLDYVFVFYECATDALFPVNLL